MIARRSFLALLIAVTIAPAAFARDPAEERFPSDRAFGRPDVAGDRRMSPEAGPDGLEGSLSSEDRQRLRRDLEGWSRGGHRHRRALDPERREAMRRGIVEHFRHHDLNGDGALDREEMRRAFPRLAGRFHHLDTDGDGRVTEAELEAAARRRAERRFAPLPKE